MDSKATQEQRVLEILKQGGWVSALDFAQLARPILRAPARIWELRQKGYPILKERRGGIWKYKLEG